MPDTTNDNNCPPVLSTRPDADVRLLMTAAKKDGFGGNWSAILNKALRRLLTPLYGSKRVRNLQEKLGVEVEG